MHTTHTTQMFAPTAQVSQWRKFKQPSNSPASTRQPTHKINPRTINLSLTLRRLAPDACLLLPSLLHRRRKLRWSSAAAGCTAHVALLSKWSTRRRWGIQAISFTHHQSQDKSIRNFKDSLNSFNFHQSKHPICFQFYGSWLFVFVLVQILWLGW